MKQLSFTLILSIFGTFSFLFSQENTISESGNVGIGTTTPNSKLDVNGRVNIDSSLVVKDSVTIEKSMIVQQDMRIEGDSRFNNVDVYGNLKVMGNSQFDSSVFMPSLGIATGVDGKYILVTQSNGLLEKSDFDSLSSQLSQSIYTERDCGEGVVPSPTWASGPNKIYSPCPQVKVGIGTTNPTHALHVTTDAKIAQARIDFNMAIGDNPSSFSRLFIKNTSLGAGLYINSSGNSSQYNKLIMLEYTEPSTEIFKVNNTSTGTITYLLEGSGKMTLNNGTGDFFKLEPNGKLTINNGTEKILQLEPNGTLRSRHIKIDVDSWADFVFEEGYQLMPLEEVEAFVKDQKHLPNVPSEQELKKSGMDVQEMNAVLMQKVEELTLYLIEQNKELETMKQRIEELETVK